MTMFVGVAITFVIIVLILYLINKLPLEARGKHMLRVTAIVAGVLTMLRQMNVI